MKRSNARWLYITPPIFFMWLFAQMDKLGLSVIITNENFLETMGIENNAAKAGLFMTGFLLTYGISSIAWGFIVDKIGPRKTAAIGISIWVVTMVMGGIVTTYGMFMASRLVLGIGEAILFPVCNKFIANWFHSTEIGRAQSTWLMGNYLGPAIGIPMIVFIIGFSGWEASFFVLALFSLIINIPMILFLTRDEPEDHWAVNEKELTYIQEQQEEEETTTYNKTDSIFTNIKFWMIWLAMLVDSLLFYGLSFWLPSYLEQERGLSAGTMGAWTSSAWLMAFAAVLIAGYISDKSQRPALVGSLSFVIGGFSIIIASTTGSSSIAGAMMGLGLACVGAVLTITQLLVVQYSSKEDTGAAAGLMGFTNIVGGFATAFMGYLVNVSGSFATSLIFLIVCMFTGALALFVLLPGEHKSIIKSTKNKRLGGAS